MTKSKLYVIGALAIAAIATVLVAGHYNRSRLRAGNGQLADASQNSQPLTSMEFKRQAQVRMGFTKDLLLAFYEKNQGHAPDDMTEAAALLPAAARYPTNVAADQFSLVYHGSLTSLPHHSQAIVLQEKKPQQTPDGHWTKIYGFADGHVELHNAPNGDFDLWEQQHAAPGSGAQ